MNPAPSIIAFTTISGLGYGVLFLLAGGILVGLIPAERWLGLTGLFTALALITGALVSSTFHLGHPERVGLALSQWRSSWLSRQGLAALLTYLPTLGLIVGWIFYEEIGGFFTIMAFLTAAGAAATVSCTGMIYASLTPIPAWHQPLTMPGFLGFALMSGALGLHVLLAMFGLSTVWIGLLALIATAVAFGLKFAYWQRLAKEEPTTTLKSATGLGSFGRVRRLDPPPQVQTHYLLDEMGFVIGRRHAGRLRILAIAFGLFGALILTILAMVLDGWLRAFFALLAFSSGMTGVLLERWLFFAEAKHIAILYYGTHGKKKAAIEQTVQPQSDRISRLQRRPVSAPASGKQARPPLGRN